MHYQTFNAVIDDIEKNLDPGEGYTLNIRTKSGMIHRDCAWTTLKGPRNGSGENVIVLSKVDHPPVYLLAGQIESMELAS